MKNGKKKKNNIFENLVYDFVKITGILPALVWMHPTVHYINDKTKKSIKGGVLISSNHVSFVDPILLMTVFFRRRVYSLVTKDLYKNKLMTFFLDAVHCIQVDKDNFSIKSFHTVTEQLKRGKAILIFPEGQVNQQSSTLMSFKSGAVLMAHKSSAKILPVYISKGDKWYHKNTVIIGEEIDVRAMCGDFPSMDALNKACDHLHNCQKQLEDYYNDFVKK